MLRKGNRSGFTLVELLVVIGIIAVLLGILLPVLAKARQAAQKTVCANQLKQWGSAFEIYCDQNKGFLPIKGPDGSNTQPFGPAASNPYKVAGYNDPALWFNALPPLVNSTSYYDQLYAYYTNNAVQLPHAGGDASIFVCPVALPPASGANENITQDASGNSFFNLYGKDSTGKIRSGSGLFPNLQFPFDMSYVFNSKLTSTGSGASQNTDVEQTKFNLSSLQPASEVVVMVEKIVNYTEYMDPAVQEWNNANPKVYGPGGYYNVSPSAIDAQGCHEKIAQPKADWDRFAARHDHGGHLLFGDGHVQFYPWPDVQFPANTLAQPNSNNWDANQYGEIRWSATGPISSN